MSDATLLLFGCAVSFIAAAGAYVALRERYLEHENAPEEAPVVAAVPVRPAAQHR